MSQPFPYTVQKGDEQKWDFLLRYQTVINVLGSAVILLMGIRAINYEGGTDILILELPGRQNGMTVYRL